MDYTRNNLLPNEASINNNDLVNGFNTDRSNIKTVNNVAGDQLNSNDLVGNVGLDTRNTEQQEQAVRVLSPKEQEAKFAELMEKYSGKIKCECKYKGSCIDEYLLSFTDKNISNEMANEILNEFKGIKLVKFLILTNRTTLQGLKGIEGLQNLKALILENCTTLQSLRGIEGPQNLEHLVLENCTTLQSLRGIEGLQNLKALILENCTTLQSLKEIEGLQNLEHLVLENCTTLQSLKEIEGLQNFCDLRLVGCIGLRESIDLSNNCHLMRCEISNDIPDDVTIKINPRSQFARSTRVDKEKRFELVGMEQYIKELKYIKELEHVNSVYRKSFKSTIKNIDKQATFLSEKIREIKQQATVINQECFKNIVGDIMNQLIILKDMIEEVGQQSVTVLSLEEQTTRIAELLKKYSNHIECNQNEDGSYSLRFENKKISNDEIQNIIDEFKGVNITSLNFDGCEGLQSLDSIKHFPNLRYLDASRCVNLKNFDCIKKWQNCKLCA